MKTISIQPESVGLAFGQQMGVMLGLPSKGKRKTIFNRLVRTLRGLDLVPANFHPIYLSTGVDNNGVGIYFCAGEHKEKKGD